MSKNCEDCKHYLGEVVFIKSDGPYDCKKYYKMCGLNVSPKFCSRTPEICSWFKSTKKPQTVSWEEARLALNNGRRVRREDLHSEANILILKDGYYKWPNEKFYPFEKEDFEKQWVILDD